MPVLPSWLSDPLWDQFAALLPDRPVYAPTHPLGCQMGRWFGFRPGYRDLVRLYTSADLHAMFEAACRDEEFLRRELRLYAVPSSAGRQITPRQVPPLIAQHRPDLKPTGRNKMWNARLVEKSSPGQPMEPVAHPNSAKDIHSNTLLWLPVLPTAEATVRFAVPGASTTYKAFVKTVSHRDLLNVLEKLTWATPETFAPELAWLRGLTADQLTQWVILMPQQARSETRRAIGGHGPFSIFERRTTGTGTFAVFSESRHRNAAYLIAGLATDWPDPAAVSLNTGRTGAVIVYPAVKRDTLSGDEDGPIDPSRVTIGFHMITPLSTAPAGGRLIKWVTVDRSNPKAVVVDAR